MSDTTPSQDLKSKQLERNAKTRQLLGIRGAAAGKPQFGKLGCS